MVYEEMPSSVLSISPRLFPTRPRRAAERSLAQQFTRAANDFVPIKRGTRISLIELHVIVPKYTLELFPFFFGKHLGYKLSLGIFGIIALNLGEDPAKCGCQLYQRIVLLWREIILIEIDTLDVTLNQFTTGWMT